LGYNTSFGAIPATLDPAAITIQNGAQIRKAGGQNVTLDPKQGITLSGGGTIRAYGGDTGMGTFEIPGPISGSGPLRLNATADAPYGPPILVLSGNNTYSGGTFVNAATVEVRVDGGLSSGDVTVASGATLRLSGGSANTYINSAATLTLNGASPLVDLAFTGTPNTIKSLYFGATQQAAGTWGAIGSGANHESALFTGTGMLNVISSLVYAQTNAILSVTNQGGGNFRLTFQGTPGAEYYLVASANVAAALGTWAPVVGSTNIAPAPSGQWSLTVTNAAPQYYRLKAVNPAL
jgi:autotransporter-associated beta strand protein